MWFWKRNCPAATLPTEYNAQVIVDNLTENNVRNMWSSRRIRNDKLNVVHAQGIAGIGLPTTLVVKKFKNMNPTLQVDENVTNRCKYEMMLLASICHENIINVLDVIVRDEAIMLVYKCAVNGNLDRWLHRLEGQDRLLSWPERMTITIGIAKGLCHLHNGCNKPIVHHNINSNNILLDQNFKAMIAGFGTAQMNMAGLDQPLPIMGLPTGNFGYAAPEYGIAPSQLTEKVDVYSFGVVLLELITGRVATGPGVDGQLPIWAPRNRKELMANHLKGFKIEVDKGIPDQARYMKEMATVFTLGVDCTVMDQQKRPSMQIALK
ncbi:hypothetical protein CFC21_038771 [Triticum aestivum]|uniref:Protein kinase domain-containing protein n=2 Tax=Triticum aestivum TaxID=4565 RepID=A0A9R1FDG8_WHEAT|nr:hypothetical protein CFC21_038771 [Triticum aestivum]CDM80035.1 unnamed protein product [Triticum aestivum]